MTIDEVIAKYKEITSTDSICPGHCNMSCDKCMQESKQIIEWLEELVMLRLDSCMIHMPERLRLVENGYNKAIDDFVKELKTYLGIENATKYGNKNAEQMRNSYDTIMNYEIADAIDDVAYQLKEGCNNER